MNKEKFNEIIAGLVCLGVIAGFGYYTGFLKDLGFGPKFLDNVSSVVSNAIEKTGIRSNTSNIGSKNVELYNGYKPQMLRKDWLEVSGRYRIWNGVFASPVKVIFYTFENENDDFHKNVSKYLENNKKVSMHYSDKSMKYSIFRNAPVGLTGPSKICNSIEECNAQRLKATASSEMSNFLESCGKTMCIINSQKNSYLRLKTRNASEATKMLNSLKDW